MSELVTRAQLVMLARTLHVDTEKLQHLDRLHGEELKELREAMRGVPEEEWKPYRKQRPGEPDQPTDRQWAEVPFVPDERSPKKDARPFRYVGIRIPRKEADLFEGPYMYFAVVTNRWQMDGKPRVVGPG